MTPTIADVLERQREVLRAATPIDRRLHPDRWSADDFAGATRTEMLASFWGSEVPGSGVYDEMLTGAVAAAHQLGWDTDEACRALGRGWAAIAVGAEPETTAGLADAVFDALETGRVAPPTSGYPALDSVEESSRSLRADPDARVLASWQGQVAGGAFGTALEGCVGSAITAVYGPMRGYAGTPTTLNDDIVYELVALDLLASLGESVGIDAYAQAWSARIPFGWSAEWVALDNLQRGLSPTDAAVVRNPMVEWIGGQMRGMVFGQVLPGQPERAAKLARVEASLTHRGVGVEGAAFAAILSALSFCVDSPHAVLREAIAALPPSPYRSAVERMIEVSVTSRSFDEAWERIAAPWSDCNWIHALPNIGAVIASLWFGGGEFTDSFALLARCGLDVDCNAGLVGTVLGAMNGSVPSEWIDPLGNRIDTYISDLPTVTITGVAEHCLRVGRMLGPHPATTR